MPWPQIAMGVASILAALYQAYQKKREQDKNMGAAGAMPQTPNYVSMAQPQAAQPAQRLTVGSQDQWLQTLLEELMKKQAQPQAQAQPGASSPLYDILSRYQ